MKRDAKELKVDWNSILNWKLLQGAHDFPGPDGGTCISEAAIVVAGFKYRKVASADDCPPCFSRVLTTFAIQLNDALLEDKRQELLMPFVTRLAGTADTADIERKRFDYIMLGLIRTVLPISLRGWQDELAVECAAIRNYDDAAIAINNIAHSFIDDFLLIDGLIPVRVRALAQDLARAFFHYRVRAVAHGLVLALAHALNPNLTHEINIAAVTLLEGAMQIGKQSEPIERSIVVDRLTKVRHLEHA